MLVLNTTNYIPHFEFLSINRWWLERRLESALETRSQRQRSFPPILERGLWFCLAARAKSPSIIFYNPAKASSVPLPRRFRVVFTPQGHSYCGLPTHIYSEWATVFVMDRDHTTASDNNTPNFKLNYLHNQSRYKLTGNCEEQRAS